MSGPDPERDRRLAARARSFPARAVPLGNEIAAFRASPEFAAMRRFARVNAVLRETLPEMAQGKVRAVILKGGVLTLEVADGILLAELRSTAARRLTAALAAAGTGATRLAWRVARRG